MKVKKYSVKPAARAIVACIALLSLRAVAQEVRSEVSVQGTGFFTKDSNGNGIKNKATETGGLLIGYRYNITRWLAAEANYGYDRNTQSYIGSEGRIPLRWRRRLRLHETLFATRRISRLRVQST